MLYADDEVFPQHRVESLFACGYATIIGYRHLLQLPTVYSTYLYNTR